MNGQQQIGFKSDDGNFDNINLFNSGSATTNKTGRKTIGFRTGNESQVDNVILKNDGSAIAKKQGYFITLKYAGSTIGRRQIDNIKLKSDRSAIANKTVNNVNDFRAGNGKKGYIVTLKYDRSAIARNRVDNIKSIVGRSAIAIKRVDNVKSIVGRSASANKKGRKTTFKSVRSASAINFDNVRVNSGRCYIVICSATTPKTGCDFITPAAIATTKSRRYFVTARNGGAL